MASELEDKVLGTSELSLCPYFSVHGLPRDTRDVSCLRAGGCERGRRGAHGISPGVRRAVLGLRARV